MNRRHFIATAGASLLASGAGAAELRGDLDILRRSLALHPGLNRYSSPEEVEARLAALEPEFCAAPTLEARYLALSRFLATIRCGHTYGNFFNQRDAVASALFDRKTRLPFHFTWIAGRMIATADPAQVGVSAGAEVISVNNVVAHDLLTTLTPYARADGHNDAKRVSLLGVSGSDSLEYFDVFHGLVFGEPPGGVHHLVLRPLGGAVQRLELPAIVFKIAGRR